MIVSLHLVEVRDSIKDLVNSSKDRGNILQLESAFIDADARVYLEFSEAILLEENILLEKDVFEFEIKENEHDI